MKAGILNHRAVRFGLVALAVVVSLFALPASALAQDEAAAAEGLSGGFRALVVFFWLVGVAGSIAALVCAYRFFQSMMAADEGNATMVEIAGFVREGANAYLRQQYKIVGMFFVIIALLLAVLAFGLEVQSRWVPFAFLTGGFFSGLAGWFGMKTATMASSRTAAGAQKSLNQGLQVAFRSGAVMGLTVVGLGLLDIMLWFAILYWLVPMFGFEQMTLVDITVTMLCFGMGASTQALFARVGGGIFTKAADVGADLVGKVEHSIPEDDARNPATIADNVGDNVGDVAGMGADLYESYCGSILATAALGVAAFASGVLITTTDGEPSPSTIMNMQLRAMLLPMAIAALGIVVSIVGIYMVRTEEDASQRTLLKALARGINLSTGLVVLVSFTLCWVLLPGHMGVAFSVVVGLLAGWLIGKWTEFSTSDEYAPTKALADQAVTGPATVIIGGVADGMLSTWAPVVIVGAATLLAFGFANGFNFADVEFFALGLYGVGIAAVGMLSTLGITLATDAYGPIADNAGGNAQMSGLEPVVRERTDALDSLGNTTAATGKGFAIGSAALTALALLAAYVEEIRAGFDRWGNTAVLASVEPGTLHKISNQFFVQMGDNGRRVKWLINPGDSRVPSWQEINFRPRPQEFDDRFELVGSGRSAKLVDKESKQEIDTYNLASATLPDFSTYYDLSVMNPKVLVGIFLGAMAVFVFCAMTMKAVGRAAKGMVEEVRRQFREKPGIMSGTDRPDYAAPVAISTKAAQREMSLPATLALLVPCAVGVILGVGGVMGLLVGGLTCGFCVAVFMANAGGSWDNAKKFIEGGAHGGKGTEAHKAAVVGDTVGDPFKDTSGPSLNILIKLMSMVSVVVAGFIVRYSLEALGIF